MGIGTPHPRGIWDVSGGENLAPGGEGSGEGEKEPVPPRSGTGQPAGFGGWDRLRTPSGLELGPGPSAAGSGTEGMGTGPQTGIPPALANAAVYRSCGTGQRVWDARRGVGTRLKPFPNCKRLPVRALGRSRGRWRVLGPFLQTPTGKAVPQPAAGAVSVAQGIGLPGQPKINEISAGAGQGGAGQGLAPPVQSPGPCCWTGERLRLRAEGEKRRPRPAVGR